MSDSDTSNDGDNTLGQVTADDIARGDIRRQMAVAKRAAEPTCVAARAALDAADGNAARAGPSSSGGHVDPTGGGRRLLMRERSAAAMAHLRTTMKSIRSDAAPAASSTSSVYSAPLTDEVSISGTVRASTVDAARSQPAATTVDATIQPMNAGAFAGYLGDFLAGSGIKAKGPKGAPPICGVARQTFKVDPRATQAEIDAFLKAVAKTSKLIAADTEGMFSFHGGLVDIGGERRIVIKYATRDPEVDRVRMLLAGQAEELFDTERHALVDDLPAFLHSANFRFESPTRLSDMGDSSTSMLQVLRGAALSYDVRFPKQKKDTAEYLTHIMAERDGEGASNAFFTSAAQHGLRSAHTDVVAADPFLSFAQIVRGTAKVVRGSVAASDTDVADERAALWDGTGVEELVARLVSGTLLIGLAGDSAKEVFAAVIAALAADDDPTAALAQSLFYPGRAVITDIVSFRLTSQTIDVDVELGGFDIARHMPKSAAQAAEMARTMAVAGQDSGDVTVGEAIDMEEIGDDIFEMMMKCGVDGEVGEQHGTLMEMLGHMRRVGNDEKFHMPLALWSTVQPRNSTAKVVVIDTVAVGDEHTFGQAAKAALAPLGCGARLDAAARDKKEDYRVQAALFDAEHNGQRLTVEVLCPHNADQVQARVRHADVVVVLFDAAAADDEKKKVLVDAFEGAGDVTLGAALLLCAVGEGAGAYDEQVPPSVTFKSRQDLVGGGESVVAAVAANAPSGKGRAASHWDFYYGKTA
jgi:hypothetical protein